MINSAQLFLSGCAMVFWSMPQNGIIVFDLVRLDNFYADCHGFIDNHFHLLSFELGTSKSLVHIGMRCSFVQLKVQSTGFISLYKPSSLISHFDHNLSLERLAGIGYHL